MKKILTILLAMTVCAVMSAQEGESEADLIERINILERHMEETKSRGRFTINGEVKTGIFWEKIEDRIDGTNEDTERDAISIHSRDDAGNSTGRFRINADYLNGTGILGFKVRLQWDGFANTPHMAPDFMYAFGYGNFFNDQLTVSIGKLGASPWGTGGPEMWRELETAGSNTPLGVGGIRIEYKPKFKFLEGHDINVGFVLNGPEEVAEAGKTIEPTLLDILSETVVGLSYKNKWFMIRGAHRFDSELDSGAGRTGLESVNEGTKLVYRVEEYALDKLLKGFSVWALGDFTGLGSDAEEMFRARNWLFIQYEPEKFTAQIRLGAEAAQNRTILYAKPYFSYRFFNGLLEPGILFGIAQDYGEKMYEGSLFSYIEVQPKLQINLAVGDFNAYTAFVYYYRMEYAYSSPPPELQTQWMNLQFGIKF